MNPTRAEICSLHVKYVCARVLTRRDEHPRWLDRQTSLISQLTSLYNFILYHGSSYYNLNKDAN